MGEMRLSRLMAMRGLCSRREADIYIEQGLVRVDGKTVTTLGTRVDEQSNITLAPTAQRRQSQRLTILLNKPLGYVSGYTKRRDQDDRAYPSAASLIVAANHFRGDRTREAPGREQRARLAPAGRLDVDSQGLLILTEDGRIARKLIGPSNSIEKEYLVRVDRDVSHAALTKLRHGLRLDSRPLKPAKVEQLDARLLRMTLTEGRKRQIRRMCEQLSLQVLSLKRTRIGRVRLGPLPRGQWRYLRENEQF